MQQHHLTYPSWQYSKSKQQQAAHYRQCTVCELRWHHVCVAYRAACSLHEQSRRSTKEQPVMFGVEHIQAYMVTTAVGRQDAAIEQNISSSLCSDQGSLLDRTPLGLHNTASAASCPLTFIYGQYFLLYDRLLNF